MPSPPQLNGNNLDIESQGIDTYRGLTDGVKPYPIKIDNKLFVFNKRPSARLQLKAVRLFAGRVDDNANLGPADMEVIHEILGSMLSDESSLDDLLDAVDLTEIGEIFNKTLEKMSARPTTGSSDSSPTPSPMTLATGSPEPVSDSVSSTG
jgi:hypothetical protein